MKKQKNSGWFLTRCTAVAVAALLLSACQTLPGLSGIGRVVPPDKRIPLTAGGAHEGQWTRRDLTVTYRYEQAGDVFTIAGAVDFARSLQTGFETLDHFSLEMVLIDGAGKIVAFRPLLTVGYRHLIGRLTFRRSITLPPDTVALAFGYRGRAREGGGVFGRRGGDSIDWHFQETPY